MSRIPKVRCSQVRPALITLLFSCGCFVGTSALADIYTYKVRFYPPVGDCHEVARQVGASFSLQARRPVSSTRCEKISESGYDFVINYESEMPITAVTTIGDEQFPDGVWGSHESYPSCMDALPQEVEVFRSETGLEPLVAFCYRSHVFRRFPYMMRIDAFGSPQSRPNQKWLMFSGHAEAGERAEISREVVEGLQKQGLRSVDVDIADDIELGMLLIRYYSPEAVRLDSEEWGAFGSKAACEKAALRLNQAYSTYAVEPLTTFCAGRAIRGGYAVVNVTFGFAKLIQSMAAEPFGSYDACESVREHIAAKYKDLAGRPMVASMCVYSDEDLLGPRYWRVLLAERTRS